MPAVHHLLKEGRGHGVYVVGGKDPRCLKVDEVPLPRLLVVVRGTGEIQVVPKLRRIDSGILHLRKRHLVRMDVVHGEQTGNAFAPRRRRDESRHPIVAVDEIRLDGVHDVVYHLALKREGKLRIAVAL